VGKAKAGDKPAFSWSNHLSSHGLRLCIEQRSPSAQLRFFMAAVVRAFLGYFFLVMIVRVVGRLRPPD
jgi:hypothetical protein